MGKFKLGRVLDDGLFVVLIVIGAVASAALETGAVMGAVPTMLPSALAQARPAQAAPEQVAASSIQVASRGPLVGRLLR
jgi:hypothetical protein